MSQLSTVPVVNIVFMGLSLALGILIPVALLIYFKKKLKADTKPFMLGVGVFIVAVVILEQLFHGLILGSSFGAALQNNTWLYAIYGGLAAGLFEETGRYVAFAKFCKGSKKPQNALMYGAGHGGFEAVMVLSLTMCNNIMYSIMANNGQLEAALTLSPTDVSASDALVRAINQLADMSPSMLLAGAVERVSAVALHLALSVLVYVAVNSTGKLWMYPVAIALHTGVNAIMVILSKYITNAWILELLIAVMCAACCWFAWKVYHNYKREYEAENPAAPRFVATPVFDPADTVVANEAYNEPSEADESETNE